MEQDMLSGLANVLDEKQAEDISILDISKISPMSDYFVIASGKNERQLGALQDACDEFMRQNGQVLKSIEGLHQSEWILMDYGDVIIHLFSEDKRDYYDLDRIWRDAKKLS